MERTKKISFGAGGGRSMIDPGMLRGISKQVDDMDQSSSDNDLAHGDGLKSDFMMDDNYDGIGQEEEDEHVKAFLAKVNAADSFKAQDVSDEDVEMGRSDESEEEEEEEDEEEEDPEEEEEDKDNDFIDDAGTPLSSEEEIVDDSAFTKPSNIDYDSLASNLQQLQSKGRSTKKSGKTVPKPANSSPPKKKPPQKRKKKEEPAKKQEEVPEWFQEMVKWGIYKAAQDNDHNLSKKTRDLMRTEFGDVRQRIESLYPAKTRFGRFWSELCTNSSIRTTKGLSTNATDDQICDFSGERLSQQNAITVCLFTTNSKGVETDGVRFHVDSQYRRCVGMCFVFRYQVQNFFLRCGRELERRDIKVYNTKTLAPILSYDDNREFYVEEYRFRAKLYKYIMKTLVL